MTKKDYIAIAHIIQDAKQDEHDSIEEEQAAELTRTGIAHEMADLCARDNPRFDRDRFLKACEVQK